MTKNEIIKTIEDNIKRWPKVKTDLTELKERVESLDSPSQIIDEIKKSLPIIKRKAS